MKIKKTKIINITVEEKPTGEIMLVLVLVHQVLISFGVKENNYLGKGISVRYKFTINLMKDFKG